MSTTSPERPIIGAMFRGPGPAKYWLPGTTGHKQHDPRKHMKPAWSLGMRCYPKYREDTGPGPRYNMPEKITRYGMDGTPKYTLHDRTSLPGSFKTPAPGKILLIRIKSDDYCLKGRYSGNHFVILTKLPCGFETMTTLGLSALKEKASNVVLRYDICALFVNSKILRHNLG